MTVERDGFDASPEPEPADETGSLAAALAMNPVTQTLLAMSFASVAAWTADSAGNVEPFVLQAPVHEPWWQLVTSIYAHATPDHLVSNAIVVLIAGGLVALATTWLRFHLFFITTGAISGAAHVWATNTLGDPVAVLGASGAAFALVGYLLVANPASASIATVIPERAVVVLVALGALAMTIFMSGTGSAYIAHLAGAVLGMLAGRVQLLSRFQLSTS